MNETAISRISAIDERYTANSVVFRGDIDTNNRVITAIFIEIARLNIEFSILFLHVFFKRCH
jgi:hypothetical protein